MSEPSGIHPLRDDGLGELLSCAPPLLDTTLDQLRTLLVVRETGSALRAARLLGREQSSVQKQMDTLNRNYQALCGEVLTVKQGRGKDVLFTPTGEAIVRRAGATLSEWLAEIHSSRRRLGSTLTVGTTEFTLKTVSRAWARLSEEFQRREVEFRVVHVRTKDVWSRLESKSVDLVCGTIVAVPGDETRLRPYDVIELARGRPVLLTNLSEQELPLSVVTSSRLPEIPLVVPSTGLIADFLGHWYGPNFRDRLDIVADIDDISYGLSLLKSGLARGCMIVTRSIGGRSRAEGLRVIELRNDLEPDPEIMTGAFVSKEDRVRYEPRHPLNLLWAALREEAAARAEAAER
jgi:DNA-binding transcriptional LysR family regulator